MAEMTRIYLVRHGETLWNKDLRYQGHRDIPLSEVGLAQAEKISARLAAEKLDVIYASDLSRAMETARIIARPHNLPIKTEPRLKETNFGLWEGLTYKELNEQFPEDMNGWRTNPRDTKIPGGESLAEVMLRCKEGMDALIKENLNRTILLVAHGGIIRMIIAEILGMDINSYWKIKQDNVALNIIEYYGEDRAILCLLNDINHLQTVI